MHRKQEMSECLELKRLNFFLGGERLSWCPMSSTLFVNDPQKHLFLTMCLLTFWKKSLFKLKWMIRNDQSNHTNWSINESSTLFTTQFVCLPLFPDDQATQLWAIYLLRWKACSRGFWIMAFSVTDTGDDLRWHQLSVVNLQTASGVSETMTVH